jgi:hypothetical protein
LGFSTCVGITLIDVGSTQQIVESADPVPSVTIAGTVAAKNIGSNGTFFLFPFALAAGFTRKEDNWSR